MENIESFVGLKVIKVLMENKISISIKLIIGRKHKWLQLHIALTFKHSGPTEDETASQIMTVCGSFTLQKLVLLPPRKFKSLILKKELKTMRIHPLISSTAKDPTDIPGCSLCPEYISMFGGS